MKIVIPSDPLAVREGLKALLDAFPLLGLPEDDRGTAEIVLAEVLNNIVEHAYAQHSGEIELTLTQNATGLDCRIVDQGLPMPDAQPPAGVLGNIDDLPEGGFGWHLIRTLSRDLAYQRVDGCNLLSFRLEPQQSAC